MEPIDAPLPFTNGRGPTVAETAFLEIVQRWTELVRDLAHGEPLKEEHDRLSRACLLLVVEWGHEFSPALFKLVRSCLKLVRVRSRAASMCDVLVWELCLAGRLKTPSRSSAVNRLTKNLDHSNSRIRLLMLELGWAARPWLGHPHAIHHLLRNLCYSHIYSDLAYVLAESLSGLAEEFPEVAASYTFPEDESTKYQENLESIILQELSGARQHFAEMEADARKLIAKHSHDMRLPN